MLARIRAGENPADEARKARTVPTVKHFAEYLRRCGPGLKPSGLRTVRFYLEARILPAFGARRYGPRPSPRSGCSRSTGAGAARC